MTATCHPLPPSVAEELLQVTARAICDRPGETVAQRDSRTRQMVHLALAMQPRDGLEYMLSLLAVGHFNLILDSMQEVFLSQTDAMKSKTKSTIVALDRALLGLVKELRLSRTRPAAHLPAVELSQETMAARPMETRSEEAENDAMEPPITMAEVKPALGEAPAGPSQPLGRGVECSPPEREMMDQWSAAVAAAGAAGPLGAPAKEADAKSRALPPQPIKHGPEYPPPGPSGQHLAAFAEALAAVAETLETVHTLEKANVAAGE